MKPLKININHAFIGREAEQKRLQEIDDYQDAAILILYGRRRVGKTELIEQTYADRNIIKIEGIEGRSEAEERKIVLLQISHYMQDDIYAKLHCETWIEVFEILAKLLKKGKWTLYFEEVQWLANYKDNFISELKYVWDNAFRHNKQLLLILCGSSPSFMINEVAHSKALYNRSQFEMHLQPLPLADVKKLLSTRSNREIMDGYLTLGGIPEYLKRINHASSIFLGICEEAFKKNGFLTTEYQRIFISSMADTAHYQKILDFLSHKHFATRVEIINHLEITPGGTLSTVMQDLLLCGFIEEYASYHLPDSNRLVRYTVSDNYLVFYYKFIRAIEKKIAAGKYDQTPTYALNQDTYYKWLGYAFERFCRKHDYYIAKVLGFSAVRYESGAYFSKLTDKEDKNFQIDLVFDRADQVLTVCEIKYLQKKVDISIIESFERKISLLPNTRRKTIHKVLIAANGVTESLLKRHYFDQIMTLNDFF